MVYNRSLAYHYGDNTPRQPARMPERLVADQTARLRVSLTHISAGTSRESDLVRYWKTCEQEEWRKGRCVVVFEW